MVMRRLTAARGLAELIYPIGKLTASGCASIGRHCIRGIGRRRTDGLFRHLQNPSHAGDVAAEFSGAPFVGTAVLPPKGATGVGGLGAQRDSMVW